MFMKFISPILLLLLVSSYGLWTEAAGQTTPTPADAVTYKDLLETDQHPANWLTYSGSYRSHRFSKLDQIHRRNVNNLRLNWVFQMKTLVKVESTPLVVNEIMYLTQPPNGVFALDARTGRPFWSYERKLPERISVCCEYVNRGLAILGDRLYLGTLDAHLVALDRKSGALRWDKEVADYRDGYSIR